MQVSVRYVLIALILLSSSGLLATMQDSIVIKQLITTPVGGQLKIQCEVDYQLDDKVNEALRNGIEMMFRLEVALMQTNRYWIDDIRAEMVREFTVKYHALSKQYVMKQNDSDTEYSFPDLYSAFYFQRYLHNATLSDFALSESDQHYYVRARARLVTEQLPLPLRIKSYIYSTWRPSSGWSIWPI